MVATWLQRKAVGDFPRFRCRNLGVHRSAALAS